MKHYLHIAGACLLSSVALGAAHAAVSAEEAAKLKTELTPLGAERAGNKEGTIPARGSRMAGAGATRSRAKSRCTASPPPTWPNMRAS